MSTADELLKAETIDLRYRIAASEARVRELERIIRLAQQDKPSDSKSDLAAARGRQDMSEITVAEMVAAEEDAYEAGRLDGRTRGAKEMRERAAKYLEDRAERMGGVSDMARQLEGAAKGVRALPVE